MRVTTTITAATSFIPFQETHAWAIPVKATPAA